MGEGMMSEKACKYITFVPPNEIGILSRHWQKSEHQFHLFTNLKTQLIWIWLIENLVRQGMVIIIE
jgi:hypothetical protein